MPHPSPIRRMVQPEDPDPACIGEGVQCLARGGLVAYPTDTVYGVGVDPRQPAAVERLFRAKGRDASAGIPLVASDLEQVEEFVGDLTTVALRLAHTFWPGPLTLVIAARPRLDRRVLGGADSVAVRVPHQPVARGLAAGLGHPITSTSANRSGHPAATTAQEAVTALGSVLTMVLDGGAAAGNLPSTIVDARNSEPALLRAGVVPWERVLQSLS